MYIYIFNIRQQLKVNQELNMYHIKKLLWNMKNKKLFNMYQEKRRLQITMQLNIKQNMFHKYSKKNIPVNKFYLYFF